MSSGEYLQPVFPPTIIMITEVVLKTFASFLAQVTWVSSI